MRRFFRAPCQEEEGGTMVDVPATVERALPEQYGGSHEVLHERVTSCDFRGQWSVELRNLEICG